MVALGLMAKLLAAWQPWCVGVKLTEYNITPIYRSRKNNTAGGEGTIESPVAALPRRRSSHSRIPRS
jgi:hypothetical protein